MLEIIAVRHTSVSVEPGTCYGCTDVGVADTFADEAHRVKETITGLGTTFNAVYCSPLTRCTLLARACGFTTFITDPRLREMNFGEWDMQRYDAITDPRLQIWYDDWQHVRATGGESFEDQYRRVADFVSELITLPHRRILIFAHAGTIVHLLRLSGLTPQEAFSRQPKYGEHRQIILQNQK